MRTSVVCKCNAQMRRRVTSNLSNMWLGLVTLLELSGGVRGVARGCHPSIRANMCAKTVTASAFWWNGDGFTEQCPWPREFDLCEGAGEARRCDYICFHITIVGWKTTLKSGNRR